MRGNKKSPRVNVSLKLGNKKPQSFPIRAVKFFCAFAMR
nr:MAG TPA: hypothetical protein [Caudoviricetes sp.]